MRISRQRAERRVQVYNIGAEYDERTEFELSREEDGKYSLSYQFVASKDMGNEEDEDFTKKGEIATGATESMTARELYFFMNGVWAGENKAAAAEGGVK
jgi:hypothetical protein